MRTPYSQYLTGITVVLTALFWVNGVACAQADEEAVAEDNKHPAARLIPLNSPIEDEVVGLVRRTALELQDIARREKRDAYLILEVSPGISQFHHVFALAEFLTSEAVVDVTTIAWVPESVTGYNVLAALACNEIVMHPDAEMGDIGRGSALPKNQQTIVQGIVAKRRNARVNEALASAMMDPAVTLLKLSIDNGSKESRLVTEPEAQRLRDQDVVIQDSTTIKESGTPCLFSGAQARANDILIVQTAQSRRELVETYGLPLESLREAGTSDTQNVAYIELRDQIDQIFTSFANRQIERAIASGAKLIIFEIDSPGGDLWFSRDLAFRIAELSERDIKTVAYVPDKAFSGGTIVAVGCDEIYMKPSATIGDAIPIRFNESGFIHAEEKILSAETDLLRQLADLKNRPAAVLEAFADKDLEVFEVRHAKTGRIWYMSEDEIHKAGEEWVKGNRVTESRPGIAITISGKRAHELKVAQSPVESIEEVKERLGIPIDLPLRRIERTWVDTLVFILNTDWATGMLFFVAIICIYIELATMTGLFGIVSAVAFALFFWSRMLGGTATGLEIVLFVVGLGLLAMEVFVVPGFGIFGVTGVLLILGSLIMASQTFTGLDGGYDLARAGKTAFTFGGAMFAVIIASMILSAYLPKIPLLKNMILMPPGHDVGDAPSLRPELTSDIAALVGAEGESLTVLRPAGKARIDGKLMDVVSDGPYIAEGAKISVVTVQGNRVVVRQLS